MTYNVFGGTLNPTLLYYYELTCTSVCLCNKLFKMLQVSAEQRLKLLKEPPRTPSVDNVWKWADAFVNKDYLTSILTYVDPYPRNPKLAPRTLSNVSTPRWQ